MADLEDDRNLTDHMAEGLTSLGLIIIALLFITTVIMTFSHTLFSKVLPDELGDLKPFSSWGLAIAWDLTLIVTTTQKRHIGLFFPKAMAILSGVMVMFFIDAFNNDIGIWMTIQRCFVGLMVSVIEFAYVFLFDKLWSERVAHRLLPARLEKSEAKLKETEAKLEQSEAKLEQTGLEVKQNGAELIELRAFKGKIQEQLTCQHCQQVFWDGYGTLQTHKGYCVKNENRRKSPKDGLKLNGHNHSHAA